MAYDDIIERGDTGNMIPPEYVAEIIKDARQDSVVLANARRLRDMDRRETKMTVEDALPMAYFVNGDNGMKGVTKSEWAGVTMTAEEIATIVPIPENVLDDSGTPIWSEVRPQLAEAAGVLIDQTVLAASQVPSTWPNSIVKEAIARNHVVTVPGTSPDYYDLLMGESGLISMVENDGYFVNGHVASIGLRGKLRGIRDEVGQPIFSASMQSPNSYMLDGVSMQFIRNGALNGTGVLDIAGDWSKLVYSIRKDMTFKVFDTGVITDPTDDNKIVYNLLQQDMIAMRLTMRIAFALPNPVNRVQPDKTARYPFAVLREAGSASL